MTTPQIEEACRVMHDAYEAAAVGAGWETQEKSRVPWEDVPEANKETMRASVGALMEHLSNRLEAEIRPLLEKDKYDGGYNCCGCSTYDEILDHAIRIVKGLVMMRREAGDAEVWVSGTGIDGSQQLWDVKDAGEEVHHDSSDVQ